MIEKYSKKIKLVLIILFSISFISLVGPHIFLAGTPKIDPDFIVKLKDAPNYLASIPVQMINSFKINILHSDNVALTKYEIKSVLDKAKTSVPTTGLSFKEITTNVEAADDPVEANIKYIKLESGAKVGIKTQTIIDANGNKKVIKILQY
jgi:hypothetical protein